MFRAPAVSWLALWSCSRPAFAMKPASKATVAAALSDIRVPMCHAVVKEMHIEIHKHKLRKKGEDDIYETVPAICMAIVQNYTLSSGTVAPQRPWMLTKRDTKLDDDEDPPDASAFEHLMTLKQCCEEFTEEFQHELSGLMYRSALELDVAPIEESFCGSDAVQTAPPPPPPPRKRKNAGIGSGKKRPAEPAKSSDGPPDMSEMLKKYDTDGSITNLIEMERDNPEAMLDADQLATVQEGAVALRCDVCRAASKAALLRARKSKALRDEEKLMGIMNMLCYGSPPESLEEYPKYPGNPPLWGEMYTVVHGNQRIADGKASSSGGGGKEGWRLKRLPKGAAIEEQGGKDYTQLVMKHSMISRACLDRASHSAVPRGGPLRRRRPSLLCAPRRPRRPLTPDGVRASVAPSSSSSSSAQAHASRSSSSQTRPPPTATSMWTPTSRTSPRPSSSIPTTRPRRSAIATARASAQPPPSQRRSSERTHIEELRLCPARTANPRSVHVRPILRQPRGRARRRASRIVVSRVRRPCTRRGVGACRCAGAWL